MASPIPAVALIPETSPTRPVPIPPHPSPTIPLLLAPVAMTSCPSPPLRPIPTTALGTSIILPLKVWWPPGSVPPRRLVPPPRPSCYRPLVLLGLPLVVLVLPSIPRNLRPRCRVLRPRPVPLRPPCRSRDSDGLWLKCRPVPPRKGMRPQSPIRPNDLPSAMLWPAPTAPLQPPLLLLLAFPP